MTTTHTDDIRKAWEALAATLGSSADSFEQNAEEMGLVDGTAEFYAECIGQAQA